MTMNHYQKVYEIIRDDLIARQYQNLSSPLLTFSVYRFTHFDGILQVELSHESPTVRVIAYGMKDLNTAELVFDASVQTPSYENVNALITIAHKEAFEFTEAARTSVA